MTVWAREVSGVLTVEVDDSHCVVLREEHLPPTPDTVITVTDVDRLADALLDAKTMAAALDPHPGGAR